MRDPLGLTVRVAHILCGVFWAGAGIMLAAFIEPALGALGPQSGKFMQRLMGPGRLGVFMTGAAFVTAGTGFTLLWFGSGTNWARWWATGDGRVILLGSAAGLAALVVGLAVNAPTAGRLARIGREIEAAGGSPQEAQVAEISRLQHRLQIAGIVSAAFLALSVIGMAAAHYF